MPYRRFAQVFAAKEAVLKALSLRWENGVFWKEIAVLDGPHGSVRAKLSGQARQKADALKISAIDVCMTGNHDYALAMALVSTGTLQTESS